MSTTNVINNPLLEDWNHYHGIPPFAAIKPEHYEPAFDAAQAEHFRELETITQASPSFKDTIVAFDRSGALHSKIGGVFHNLCSSNGVPDLQTVELKLAAPLAAYRTKIYTFPGLFAKIDAVYEQRNSLGLNGEDLRLVERVHLDFVRSGAKFDEAKQARYSEIMKDLAKLSTQFNQNLLADESQILLHLTGSDLEGLPGDLKAAARQAALDRGATSDSDEYIVTLSRSLVEPFITHSAHRDLRERAWKLWTSRGELDPARNNLAIAKQILLLRQEQASMHGYETFSDYATADTMAGTPARVMELLENVWTKGKESIGRERTELQAYIAAHEPAGATSSAVIEPWDWRYYAEKVRQSKYDLDESEAKPYFSLDRMVAAIFDVAHQLFGLTFTHKPEIAGYHEDVKVYEVTEGDRLVALFLHDNYARPFKKSGAWMSHFRIQCKEESGHVIPIVVNNNNFNKGSPGEPTLLSFTDARTLFHEFGHGLHGMLSNVTHKRLAGTSVLRDFVELPSQLFEHWLSEPAVLQKHARHHITGEVIPQELLNKIFAARCFGQGFQTIEYTSSALVDVSLHHKCRDYAALDISAFEKTELERHGMPQGIVMRHRPAHFQHLFASSAYASAYYVYLWAEVLDADGFDAFKETGDCFNREVADRVRRYIYSTGNSLDPAEAFRLFRGRDPAIEPMLRKKGLLPPQ